MIKTNLPRRNTSFILSSLSYLIFVRLSISEPSWDYIIIILGGNAHEICKKIVSVLAVCGLIMLSIPFSAIPVEAAILYTLNDGVLTIKSQGVIEKYSDGTKLPWYDERDQITSIVLQDGVTEIGDSLFSNLTALEKVSFPDTLTSIGTNSFRNCSTLKSIELPSSLISIGTGAFGNCTQLQFARLSEGLESIGSWSFAYCSELTEIQLPETLTEIGSAAFYECSSLTNITIPANVTELNEFTFVACSALEDIMIQGELTYLGGSVFGGTKWFSEQTDWVIVQDKFCRPTRVRIQNSSYRMA